MSLVFTAATDSESRVGIFRLEITLTDGTGKLRIPSGLEPSLKESLNRAVAYLQNMKQKMGIEPILAKKDIYAEAINLSGGKVECACSVAFTLQSFPHSRTVVFKLEL